MNEKEKMGELGNVGGSGAGVGGGVRGRVGEECYRNRFTLLEDSLNDLNHKFIFHP